MIKVKIQWMLFLMFIFLSINTEVSAQGGVWTWINGSQQNSYAGNYGSKGVSSPTNQPPARYQAATWTDLDGNFWMFGGSLDGFVMNDLWKYQVSTNEWIWIHGPQLTSNQNGNYGIKGISSPNNIPAARAYGALNWVGSDGNLYIYGGATNGGASILSDLWCYDISLNEWVWLAGSSNATSPNYGSLGIASPTNTPGSRYECNSTWVYDDKLWFFGGAYGGTNYNDVWVFDLTTNFWTWVGGNNIPSYGIKGVSAPTNLPPKKINYTHWKDRNNNFYFFAGSTLNGSYNDLWSYNPTNLLWTWIGGSQNLNDIGQNNGYCSPNISDYPRARSENMCTQYDLGCATAFWTFGGFNYNSTLYYNDLWVYNNANKEWTLVWGDPNNSSQLSYNYGLKGISNTTNAISPRGGGGIWTDKDGNLYIFGGISYDYTLPSIPYVFKGDMWKFVPDSACYQIETNIFHIDLGNDTSICNGETFILDATTPNATYLWQDNSVSSTLNVTQHGTYWVEVTDSCQSVSDTIIINEKGCEIILEMPNIFTPNEDEFNNTFTPLTIKGVVSMHTLIYDRWGNKVFETDNIKTEWDGHNVADGTYFWIVYYTDINEKKHDLKGHVTVLH